MTTQDDIRWMQRFNQFSRAFARLKEAVELSEERPLSELEEQGLIQAFEYTHELAWNVLKDFLEARQGLHNLFGSKDSTREAFKRGIIDNGEVWMDMITSRNLSTHTYNEEIAQKIVRAVKNDYFAAFSRLLEKLQSLAE